MLRLASSRGFTLIETLIGASIGSMAAVMMVQALVATARTYQRLGAETRVRINMAADIRLLETAVRGATGANGVLVRQSYTATTETTATGTCVYVRNPVFATGRGLASSSFAFYYYNPTPAEPEAGGIYLDEDTASVPDPASDRKLFDGVEAFEVRTGLNQAYRIAVRAQVRGSRRENSASPGNKIYLSSGVIRRTPPGA